MKAVNSVLVVGGGTAGLISAIILKKKLDIKIDIVHSKDIGIIGVGEGSTEHWKEFMDYAGIDQYELIRETDATYKSGIMFEGWNDQKYLHSVATPLDSKTAQYHHVYSNLISNNIKPISPKSFWDSKIDKIFLNQPKGFPANQFHFNTHKLNEFLIKIAKSIGINIIEDEVLDLTLDNDGYIDFILGKKTRYKYDFYIDSTGFKRFLISKLGGKWESYKKYLKMKSAIVFQTEDEDNYNFWTLAKAMDYGWMFRIPVWGRYGNGYIYDSDYITEDQATQEVEKLFQSPLEIRKKFKFDPGALSECWIKNCCAIGVSANFVEPLEASSIGTSIQQSFLLMHRISQYDEKVIKNYNKSISDIMKNIRDFICLHYMTKKDNTDFWRDLKNVEIPDSLLSNLEVWKDRLPINEDFNNLSDYILFRDTNFIMVMEGLELFNRSSIRREYQSLHPYIKNEAEQIVSMHRDFDSNLNTITHKDFLTLVRNPCIL
jgi:tryptophan halogenase